MSDVTDPLEWVAKAEGDYTMMLSAIRRKNPVTFAACFHAQQCVEKYLKAMLIAKKKTFPKIHDLLQLSVLCEQAGIIVPVAEDSLDRLTKFAVVSRYPGNVPTSNQARDALETAKAVRKFARKFLNVK